MKQHVPVPSNSSFSKFTGELPWIFLVVAGSLAPLLFILASGRTLAWRDTSRLFAPMRSLIADSLRHGRLPLWNPYEALGMPLFAQLLHGVLHPWSLFAAFVSGSDGMDLLICLHVATGAVGAGVLARALGASRNGASIAGVSYGLSGYLLGTSAVIQYLAAGATAPWAVAGLYTAARGKTGRVALGSAGMAVLHLAGDPQWFIVAALMGILLAWKVNGRTGVLRAAAAVAAGTALAAIQLMPSWALYHETSRIEGLSLQDRAQWALLPSRVIEFVIPGLFDGLPGAGSDPVYAWLGGGAYPLPFLPSVFLGLPVLFLAASSVLSGRSSRILGWTALFFLWLSFGHIAGAGSALGWVPVWNSFRYAEKLIGPFTLCVSVLAALGLERFIDHTLPRAARPLFIVSVIAALLAVGAAVLAGVISPHGPVPEDAWSPLWRRFASGLVLAAAGSALLGVAGYRRERRGAEAARWIVAAVVVTGLAGSAAALHAGVNNSRARAPLAYLRSIEQVPRIANPVQEIALPALPALDDFDALQAVQSRSGSAPYMIPSRIDNFTTYTGLVPKRFNTVAAAFGALGESQWTAFRRFAVSHIVLTQPLTQADELAAKAAVAEGRLVRTDPAWGISVWEVPHRPWAGFAEHVLPVATEDEAVKAVVRLEREGDRTTVLRGERPAMLSQGSVLSVERQADRVRIEAEATGDGLLVVADAVWDGWKATLDGRRADIETADGLVRAVRWPAGRHILEMRYRPVEVRLGEAVSGAAVVLLLGFTVWERRRNRGPVSR